MGSLTGGGGLSNSSAASSGTGDQSFGGAFNVGGMTFGNSSGQNNQLMILGAIALIGLLVWKR